MKGLDPKRASELFRSNSKKHFKMYKAGRKWLVAGISAMSGLLGLGTVSTSAKADTSQNGAAKQLDSKDVAATQTTGTIPATSQTTVQSTQKSQTAESAATSTTAAASQSETEATASESISTSSAAASTSTTEKSLTTGATGSTAPATSASTATVSEAAPKAPASSAATSTVNSVATNASTTAMANSAANSLSTNETSASTSTMGVATASASASVTPEASASASTVAVETTSLNLAAAFNALPMQGLMRMAVESYGLTLDQAEDLATTVDSAAYAVGQGDAAKDIQDYISKMTLSSSSIFNKTAATGIQKISDLMDAYATNNSLQDLTTKYGTPTWTGSTYDHDKATTISQTVINGQVYSMKDFNAGYAAYSAAFVQGLQKWMQGVTTAAKNTATANELLNAATYNPSALDGSGSSGTDSTALGSTVATILNLGNLNCQIKCNTHNPFLSIGLA